MDTDFNASPGSLFPPTGEFAAGAHVKNVDAFYALYKESIEKPEEFWGRVANEVVLWKKPWTKVLEWKPPFAKWFLGGKLNISENCLDRHLNTQAEKRAIIWEGEDGSVRTFTYRELHREVSKFANVLRNQGVMKGDRVCMYLPMVPEAAIAMLACARIGAIHTVVFGGFSAQALRTRVQDAEAKILITSDGSFHAGKTVPLKKNADEALSEGCECIKHVIVVKRTGIEVAWNAKQDLWYEEEMKNASPECIAESMDSEDPLFILYTSGTTGKPKGVLHTTGGYLVYATLSHKLIFDIQKDDVYWCTADVGWITGHSYIVYGPLSNGTTVVMFEGVPSYPTWDRFWQVIEKHKVTKFYTAPTAIRAIAKQGDELPKKHDLSSLKLLGSVGEPINPEAWKWYHSIIGNNHCPIVDTWWQTETGGVMITPLPGATTLKPGSATFPFLGIDAAVFRDDGAEADPNEGGNLVIRKPWPGMLRSVWKNEDRYTKTYFGQFGDSIYVSGDGAKKDADGYFWITGRLDDVLKVSGHRIGTAEVESALVSYPGVAEAAVVPIAHEIKGQAIYAFVTLKEGQTPSEELIKNLRAHVGTTFGPIAKPDVIQFADGLPKTRSGKIMRRILKAIANKEEIGDTTTLADPSVVEVLKNGRIG
ncbi:MAG TPA: acetate--CoA ligase [Candidatus Peribacterales bacterium]|nr:acetate--CoA ligase [Candidatus Peribacterales bacterium]